MALFQIGLLSEAPTQLAREVLDTIALELLYRP